jgi:hypothetical protein
VPLPHPLDIVALLLGVFLLMRKSEVRAEDPANYAESARAEFDTWRASALAAYTIGTRACFGRVFADFFFLALLRRVEVPEVLRWGVGLAIDLGWVALLVLCWSRARAAHKLRVELASRRELSHGTSGT